jgi:hypothetical protein
MNHPAVTATSRRHYTIFFLSLFLLLVFVITLGGYRVVFYSGSPLRQEAGSILKAKEPQEKKVIPPVSRQ